MKRKLGSNEIDVLDAMKKEELPKIRAGILEIPQDILLRMLGLEEEELIIYHADMNDKRSLVIGLSGKSDKLPEVKEGEMPPFIEVQIKEGKSKLLRV